MSHVHIHIFDAKMKSEPPHVRMYDHTYTCVTAHAREHGWMCTYINIWARCTVTACMSRARGHARYLNKSSVRSVVHARRSSCVGRGITVDMVTRLMMEQRSSATCKSLEVCGEAPSIKGTNDELQLGPRSMSRSRLSLQEISRR